MSDKLHKMQKKLQTEPFPAQLGYFLFDRADKYGIIREFEADDGDRAGHNDSNNNEQHVLRSQ